MMKTRSMVYVAAVAGVLAVSQAATAVQIKVTVTNTAPAGGVYLTPVWVGFHEGGFDTYGLGVAASDGLESIAEDGVPTTLSTSFQDGTRVDGGVGGGPIAPGDTVMAEFSVGDTTSDHRFFSYVSMVLPSSDYFIANGNPTIHNLSSLIALGDELVITVDGGEVNDAGTEVNDFATSAGNGFFNGLPDGQSGPDQGTNEGGVVTLVTSPYLGFDSRPSGFNASFPNLAGFNNSGIATITLSVVPEPASALLLAAAGAFMFPRRRRQVG
jgi:hypothetical protein